MILNDLMSTVEDAEISGDKVKTWAEIAGLSVTDITVTTTD